MSKRHVQVKELKKGARVGKKLEKTLVGSKLTNVRRKNCSPRRRKGKL